MLFRQVVTSVVIKLITRIEIRVSAVKIPVGNCKDELLQVSAMHQCSTADGELSQNGVKALIKLYGDKFCSVWLCHLVICLPGSTEYIIGTSLMLNQTTGLFSLNCLFWLVVESKLLGIFSSPDDIVHERQVL